MEIYIYIHTYIYIYIYIYIKDPLDLGCHNSLVFYLLLVENKLGSKRRKKRLLRD